MIKQVGIDYLMANQEVIRIVPPVLKLAGDTYFLTLRQDEKELCSTLSEEQYRRLVNHFQLKSGGTA